MSLKAMAYVWDTPLKGSQKLMLLAIADRCNDEGECFPGVKRLAKKCNISERTTRKTLKKLEEIGELVVSVGGGIKTRNGDTNRYYLSGYRMSIGLNVPDIAPREEQLSKSWDTAMDGIRRKNAVSKLLNAWQEAVSKTTGQGVSKTTGQGVSKTTGQGVSKTTANTSGYSSDKVLSFPEIEASELDAAIYDKSSDVGTSGKEIVIADGELPAINLDEHHLLNCPENTDEQSYRQVMRERITKNTDARMIIASLKDKKLICSNPNNQDIYSAAVLKAIEKYSSALNPMYEAIEKVFNASNGLNGNIKILLTGQSKSKKKTEWLMHSLLFPATVQEILDYGKWYKREFPEMSPITTPEKLASSFEQFRQAQTNPQPRQGSQKIMTAADAPQPVTLTPEQRAQKIARLQSLQDDLEQDKAS